MTERLTDEERAWQPSTDGPCEVCGRDNIVWFAPSTIWNEVMGSPGGLLCPMCFVRRAETCGLVPTAWRLAPENAERLTDEGLLDPVMDRRCRQVGAHFTAAEWTRFSDDVARLEDELALQTDTVQALTAEVERLRGRRVIPEPNVRRASGTIECIVAWRGPEWGSLDSATRNGVRDRVDALTDWLAARLAASMPDTARET